MASTADLQIAIRVLGDAERDIRSLGSEFRALGGHVSSAAPSFNATATAIAAGTVAANVFMGAVGGLITLLKGSVTAGSEFSQSMANIRATLPKQDVAQFSGQLEALALKLGKDYPLSAADAGRAMELLAQKGITAKDILGGTAEAVVQLSSATGADLATSAQLAAVALDTFNLDASQMNRVTDVMTAAVLRGGTSITDFGFAMQAGAAAVRLAGGDIDDTALAIAALAKTGIEGSDAGTSLKTMYMNLIPSTKDATKVMRELGLMTKDGKNQFFDANGQVKDFEEISRILANSLKGLTKEQQLQKLETMFGSDAIRAAAAAAALGRGEFGDLAAAMREQGIAAGAAAEKNNSLKGDINSLTGTWETLQIVLSRRLEPAMRRVVQTGNALLGMILDFAQSDAFTEWTDAAVAGVQDVAQWLVDLGDAIVDFSRNSLAQIPVVGTAFQSIGFLIGGVVQAAGAALTGDFGGALDAVTEGSSDLVEAVVTGWPQVTNALRATATFITGTVVPAWVALQMWLWDKLQPVIVWLTSTGWPMLLNAVRAVASFVTGTVVPAIQSLWTWLSDHIPAALVWVANTGWPMLVNAAKTAASFITGTVIPAVTGLAGWLSDKVPPAVNAVLSAFESVKNRLTPIVTAIFGGDLKAALAGLGSAFADFASLALGWLGAQAAKIDWAGVWNKAVGVVVPMASWFASWATTLAGWLGDRVKAIDWGAVWAKAVDVAAKMAAWFSDLTAKLVSWIGDKVKAIDWADVWKKAQNVVADMAQWFVGVASTWGGWLGDKVADIDWQGVWAKAVDVAGRMAQWFADVATRFAGWISEKVAEIDWGNVWSQAVEVASHMAQWFLDAASRFTTWLGEQAAAIDWGNVWSYATDVAAHMGQWFIDLSTRLAGWIGEQVGKVDWAAVWATVVDAPEKFADWLNDTVKNTDWAGIGGTIGAMMGATIRGVFEMLGTSSEEGDAADQLSNGMAKSLGSALVSAVTKIDVVAMQTALISFWTGVLTKAWEEATKGWKPSMPTPTPAPGTVTVPTVGREPLSGTGQIPGGLGQYQQMAYQAAVAAGIDPNLFLKQIGQESNFKADAVSKAGALGIAQFMPGTARSLGIDPMDPAQALPAAAKMMADFLKQYGGDYRMALAAYNAGPGNLSKYGLEGVLADDFAHGETKKYVQTILGSLGGPTGGAQGGGGVRMPLVRGQMSLMDEGLSYDEAIAACGPYAAIMFANAVGRYPTAQEAIDLARKFGWNPDVGMTDYTRTVDLVTEMMGGGGTARSVTPTMENLIGGLGSGPVAINTPRHYFVATGYDPATGLFDVGGSGTVMRGGSAQMTLEQMSALGGGLRQLIVLNEQAVSAWQGTTQATEDAGSMFTDVDQAVVSVTASLFSEHGRLVATGQANKDLARDTLPTINALEQQGAISAETAEQLRTMALDILKAGDNAMTAQDALSEAATVTEGLGDATVDTKNDYRDLASTFRTTRLDPQVNTDPIETLMDAASTAQDAIGTIDDAQITPNVDLSYITAGTTAALGLGSAVRASDDVVSVPQADPYFLTNATSAAGALGVAVQQSDDVTSVPPVDTYYLSAATGAAGALAYAVQASDDVASVPQVDPAQIVAADSRVHDLGVSLDNVDNPHVLAFSANVPSTVTVSKLVGSDTDLNGVGNISAGDINAGHDINVDNDVRVADKVGAEGAVFGGSPIINPGFQFNFAAGGRPPLGVASLVGELGPELFVPDRGGTILPADQTAALLSGDYARMGGGGGGGVTVVVNVTGNTILGKDRAVAQELAKIIAPELSRRVSVGFATVG